VPSGAVPAGKAIEIPGHLVSSLITQILDRPRQQRYATFMATSHLVDDWYSLLLDGEKLLGHMLLVHSAPNEVVAQSTADLWSAHSKLHGKARKGSANDWEELTSAHASGLHDGYIHPHS
jgi:hypothetical protein